ncbi:aminoacyl-tRNA hydrolase [soil metagenome]
MKYLIAGLGNIGSEYAHTRHNIGFDVLDYLVRKEGTAFRTDRHGDIAEIKHKGKTFYLLKPNTYMNLSGKAVRYWMQTLRVLPFDVLVVTDDIALPVAKLRMRKQGSDGGHNGLKSITEMLLTQDYPRLRIGVGSDFPKGRQAEYVLGKWKPDEEPLVQGAIEKAAEAILSFGAIGLERTMNVYNT